MTLGKGIGGESHTLAALLATKDCLVLEHGDQGGAELNGDPLMCAAGFAVLERNFETGVT